MGRRRQLLCLNLTSRLDLVGLADEVYAVVRDVALYLRFVDPEVFGWRPAHWLWRLKRRNHDQPLVLEVESVLLPLLRWF